MAFGQRIQEPGLSSNGSRDKQATLDGSIQGVSHEKVARQRGSFGRGTGATEGAVSARAQCSRAWRRHGAGAGDRRADRAAAWRRLPFHPRAGGGLEVWVALPRLSGQAA